MVVLGSAVPQDLRQWAVPPKTDPVAERLRATTSLDDRIATVGCDWNPAALYFADRLGLMLRDNNVVLWKRESHW